jgi:hypothetical protein
VRVAALVLIAGCGRFGFDARVSTSDGATDTPRDTSTDTASDGPAVCGGLYCDDFESASLDPRWMPDVFHGSAGVDSTRAHSGTQSLLLHTNTIGVSTTNPRATLISYDALPVTGTLYFRAWIYKASPRPTGFFDQTINFADAAGDGISTGAKDGMMANNDYTVPQTYQQSATTMEPADAWTCWIFQMPSGTTGPTRVLLGGTEVTDAKIDVTSTQPAPDHLYLGTEWVGSPTSLGASDVWIDDVELATQPIGCN